MYPLFIDAYILFDRKTEDGSDWRIIGRQHNFIPKNIENVFFTYGEGSGCKKMNVFGEVVAITPEEASTLPFISPKRDFQIKKYWMKNNNVFQPDGKRKRNHNRYSSLRQKGRSCIKKGIDCDG